MATHYDPNSPQYISALRKFLSEVPRTESFQESLRLTSQAFNAYDPRENLALDVSSDDALYFGEANLVSIFGQSFRESLSCLRFNLDPGPRESFTDAVQLPRDLRNRVDRFAVVGFDKDTHSTKTVREYPRKVILRIAFSDQMDFRGRPLEGCERACESVRVRGGLMNRRQAMLLAQHLNGFRRNPSRHQVLTWKVIRGPEPRSSARAWLDGMGGEGFFMRRLLGDVPNWGIDDRTFSRLAIFDAEAANSWHAEQVFAYRRPRHVLPVRFEVSFVHKERPRGVPEGARLTVYRDSSCAESYAMATAYVQAGFIDDNDAIPARGPYFRQAEETGRMGLWPYDDDADGIPRAYSIGDGGPFVYATSLTAQEAREVMLHLRRLGRKEIRVRALGIHGHFAQGWHGTSAYLNRQVSCGGALGFEGAGEVQFAATAHAQLPDKHDRNWPLWAIEYCEDERARQDATSAP